MYIPKEQVVKEVTAEYLDTLDVTNLPAVPEMVGQLFTTTNDRLQAMNTSMPKGMTYRMTDTITNYQVAMLLAKAEEIALIQCSDRRNTSDPLPLGIYQRTGPSEGLYSLLDGDLDRIILQMRPGASEKDIREVRMILRNTVPIRQRTPNRDLVPVANGIFDYRSQVLLPFSPDYVFLSKISVPYNPSAQNVVIHNDEDGTDWDVESWMKELFDDQELVNLLWHIIGAVVRSNVGWGRTAWFYSSSGNSGKGTILALLRALVGRENCVSVRLADMDKNFSLEPIMRAACIMTDENNVGEYVDKSSNAKALVTGDNISISRKYRDAVEFQFRGFMIQCFNDLPRVRDRTDSFSRRCLIIEFDKCFTGRERKYIKEDYLIRPEVLEYVLYRVLTVMPQYYELPVPAACKTAADAFSLSNNPVMEFALECLPQMVKYDVYPFEILYILYKNYLKDNNPSSTSLGKNTFITELTRVLQKPPLADEWMYPGRGANNDHIKVPFGYDCGREELLSDYGIAFPGEYVGKRVTGIVRRNPVTVPAQSEPPTA